MCLGFTNIFFYDVRYNRLNRDSLSATDMFACQVVYYERGFYKLHR